ncbi:quinone oxidoreductase-like protein 2 [Phymastichus coffea]|uniref:quinone oxidoreductase-like protein 2 n=1 Tax=Phymastichus coffea TaxID=108790 RepID=UPI00273BEF2F|nr:quinone oxidoreductase-like protein 2 [Phymastichus coffea]XP_058799022.1 quinone oxidoreductase-like protein 2 [Phymastichus coffea]
MSIAASRSLLSCLLRNSNKTYAKYLINVRFKSEHSDKKHASNESNMIERAVLKKFSEKLHIESVDSPKKLQSTEVLIDVNYCALNGPDVLLCENLYSYKPKLPFVPGYEVCGKLVEISEGARKAGFNVGDKVVALNKECFGGLAERCIAEVRDVWKIPSSIRSIDAVCLLEYYMTALIGLEQCASIDEEDMVLINVGIGGIGLAAVDIAANVYKAKVIGVGFSEDKAHKIRERGAFHAFSYKEKKLLKEIEEIAGDRDIKDIFEGDSGKHFKKVLDGFMNIYKSRTPSKHLLRDDNFGVVVQHLARDGKIIIAGTGHTSSDNEGKGDDRFTVTGISLKDYRKRKYELYRQTGEDVISFFEEGLIKPVPSMIAGFYHINDAVKFISEMKHCGKVIIDIKQKDKEAKAQ